MEYVFNCNNSNPNTNSTINHQPQQQTVLYTGRWTPEEQEYAEVLMEEFKDGTLALPEGRTLRAFLAEQLQCRPKRISKKYSNTQYNGKQCFKKAEKEELTPVVAERRKQRRAELRRRFEESRSKITLPGQQQQVGTLVEGRNIHRGGEGRLAAAAPGTTAAIPPQFQSVLPSSSPEPRGNLVSGEALPVTGFNRTNLNFLPHPILNQLRASSSDYVRLLVNSHHNRNSLLESHLQAELRSLNQARSLLMARSALQQQQRQPPLQSLMLARPSQLSSLLLGHQTAGNRTADLETLARSLTQIQATSHDGIGSNGNGNPATSS